MIVSFLSDRQKCWHFTLHMCEQNFKDSRWEEISC